MKAPVFFLKDLSLNTRSLSQYMGTMDTNGYRRNLKII